MVSSAVPCTAILVQHKVMAWGAMGRQRKGDGNDMIKVRRHVCGVRCSPSHCHSNPKP